MSTLYLFKVCEKCQPCIIPIGGFMEELRDYLFQNGITHTKFAERLGISKHYLSRILAGKHIPGKLLLEKIQRLTKGHIKPTHFALKENK